MSEKINDGGPAFPVASDVTKNQTGMTLRDYAAIHIFAGLYAGRAGAALSFQPEDLRRVAEIAYRAADAILAAKAEEATR